MEPSTSPAPVIRFSRKLSHGAAFGTPGNPPAAVPYVGLLYGAVPAALLVVSLFFILPYGLNRRTVNGIQQQLASARQD